MAKKASAANVQADMAPPNYRSAVQHIRSAKAKKDKISGINGEIAQIYAKVEGFKVNAKAGKIFYALDNMTPEDRLDVMRSLNGLCDAAGRDETDSDLVDDAEGKVVHLRVGGQGDAGADIDEALGEGDDGDDLDQALTDGFSEASEAELAKQKGRADAKAKERAREALDKAPKKASITSIASPKKSGAPEPYTGDNSDLADPKGAA